MTRMRRLGRLAARAQRGVILFIALIVLVAMSLAGIALMRSVDTNVLIAGNLAFRQATSNMADVGIEAARGWLSANTDFLDDDQPGGFTAYWANLQTDITNYLATTPSGPADFDWSTAQTVASPDPAYEIAYVIHRMCKTAGSPTAAGTECMKVSIGAAGGADAGSSKGQVNYGTQGLPGISVTYFRVTVRVTGPRNTYSYVQAMLN
jgi:type IV pilus assembly protein PilX